MRGASLAGSAGLTGARAQVCMAVCGALKWLVVNEELCQAFAREGGVDTICQARLAAAGLPPAPP